MGGSKGKRLPKRKKKVKKKKRDEDATVTFYPYAQCPHCGSNVLLQKTAGSDTSTWSIEWRSN